MLLEADISRIQQFDLDSKLKISSHITEVIKMKNAVDNMKTGLRSFKKYVSADLVSELIKLNKEAVLGTERKELTIFFSDIANFTTIAENLSPEQLSENLGEYFKEMTKIILQNNGTVDNYTGDSIMAFWGAPHYIKDHAVSGCYVALQCQRYLDTLDKRWTEKGIPLFATRMGLNTGDAIVGNIGYEERFAYTAIGDNVNLASRLEGLNKFYGTRIMISEFTYAQAREHIEARLIDVVSVKGKSKSVMVYELISEKNNIGNELKQFIDLFNYGAAFYLDRKWSEAIKVFKKTCKISCWVGHNRPIQTEVITDFVRPTTCIDGSIS
jgi:adenylate cyclase